ncbi:MAG: oligosaccharide flippase family protein [Thermoplasmata archaeon]
MDITTENTGEGLLYQYLANIIITISGMFFYLYTIHYFNTDVVGLFSLLLAIASLFNILFSLGFPAAISHFISYSIGRRYSGDIKKIIKYGILIGLSISLISFLFVFSFSEYISNLFFHNEYDLYLKLLSFDIFLMVLNNFLVSILFGLQKFKYVSIVQSSGNLISYFSGFIIYQFIHILYIIIIGWILGNFIITIFSIILIIIYDKNIKVDNQNEFNIKKMFAYSIPIYASNILGYGATYVDRFVVSYFLNLSDFGIYSLAILMVTALGFLQGPLNNVLLPKFSKFFGENDLYSLKLYSSKAFIYILIINVSLTFILAGLSPWIIIFISNENYLQAAIPFTIISIIISISLSGGVLSVEIQSVRRNWIFVISSLVAILTNVTLCFALIPNYKLIGAGIAFSISTLIYTIILLSYTLKLNIFKLDITNIIKIYISGLIVFLILIFIQKFLVYSTIKLFLLIIFGYSIYILLIRSFKILKEEDLEIIKSITPKKFYKIVKFFEILLFS